MKCGNIALILLVTVLRSTCSDIVNQATTETENKSESHNEGKPFDHSAFLEISDTEDMHIQNSKESRLKMRKLIRQIDNDKDGKLSSKEMEDWTRQVMDKYVLSEGQRQMPKIDKDGDQKATWDEYKVAAGYRRDNQPEATKTSEQSKKLDHSKFEAADGDHDGQLSSYELGVMIHPHESPRMSQFVVIEFLNEIDKDKDGKVSFQEFSGFEEFVPDGNFKKLDTDSNGVLDLEELTSWLTPKDKHPFQTDVENLIQEIDANKDGFLTEKEIFKRYAIFATSRATKYGRLLKANGKNKTKLANETKRRENDEL